MPRLRYYKIACVNCPHFKVLTCDWYPELAGFCQEGDLVLNHQLATQPRGCFFTAGEKQYAMC